MRLSVIVGIIGLLLALLLVDPAGLASDTGLFFGRFHPTIVHFPVALLLLVAGIEFLVWRGLLAGSAIARSAPTLLFLAVWGAIAAALAGLFLAQGGGYDLGTFSWHQRLGIVTAVASAFAFVWRSRTRTDDKVADAGNDQQPGGGYVVLIGLLVVLVAIAGHLGGTLTHGEGYLTRYAPDLFRKIVGLGPKADVGAVDLGDPATATVYETLIRPVLADKCISCHNSEIRRGDLSLDSPDDILEGGEEGPIIISGRGSESDLVKHIWLPPSDRDHMPPIDRPQITVAEAELIRWWIDNGASFEQKISEAESNPTIDFIFSSWGVDEIPTGVFALSVAPADSTAIVALRESGMAVSFVAENQPFVQVRCGDRADCMNAGQVAALTDVADQVIWLDLARSTVGDAQLEVLARFQHLTRLHLENTGVTDDGLEHIRNLPFLEYVNLYGTQISDAGLSVLDTLPALQRLYLWQSDVTREGADAFKSRRPDVVVNVGAATEE